MIKRYIKTALIAGTTVAFAVVPALAVTPGAEVKNENANPNACWGMDRAFYADGSEFKTTGGNMDIKRSFPGKVGEQRADWVATYCEAHGPTE